MKIDNSCCIVSVATGIYAKGHTRLLNSLKSVGYAGDTLFFTDTLPEGCPEHNEIPMAFKPFAIKEAIKKGYKYILWLDANMIVIRNPLSIFNKIDKDGYYFWFPYSNTLGQTCSDLALQKMNLDREKALTIPDCCSACFGLKANNEYASNFLNDFYTFAMDGVTFRGIPKEYSLDCNYTNPNGVVSKDKRVIGHRYDQPVVSFLVWKHALKRSHIEVKDIQSTKDNVHVYSKAISLEVEVVQNRDTKTDTYIITANKWLNFTGTKKCIFIALSILDILKRRYRYYKNEHTLKKGQA